MCAIVLVVGVTATSLGTPVASAARNRPTRYYVALGDSIAQGYENGTGGPGYTRTVAKKARMISVNFACGGLTTTTILTGTGCHLPAIDAGPAYPTTSQAAAAVAFIRAHRGEVGLISVQIGGAEGAGCSFAPDPATCISASGIRANITTLAQQLRAAAGPNVPLVGVTYFNPYLADWLDPTDRAGAIRTIGITRSIFNPTLTAAYAAAGGRIADVTAAAGTYLPLTVLKNLKSYGKVPKAVANVCKYTNRCGGDVHNTPKGNKVVAKTIVNTWKTFPKF
jgi:lysophospholipase L1-like esterase